MFPFDFDDDDELTLEEDAEKNTSEPSDYEIDFTTGKLTGRIITGLPAVIQWIRLALMTERYFYNQFSWDYGNELLTLIGKSYSKEYIDSEVTRMVKDALSVCDDIDSVSNIIVEYENDSLEISFNVSTPYGKGEVSVNV